MKLMTRDNRWHIRQASTPARGLSELAMMMEIGRDLRSTYRDVLKEPLPEHLACIVRKLDRRASV
jgi:flagellar biosynthesis regulator FlbT